MIVTDRDAQLQLLLVVESFGPMTTHDLLWKAWLPERKGKRALRILLGRRLIEPCPDRGDLVAITAVGRQEMRS